MSPSPSASQQHAVIIGASITGLLVARVLADHFDKVTVLEQDALPQGPTARRGVPQANQPHVLLAKGCELLEGFFPGLTQELEREGAIDYDFGERAYLNFHGTQIPHFRAGVRILSSSRALLEWGVLRRLRALPRVELREGLTVTGLKGQGPGQVRGVQVRRAGSEALEELEADLVVDASGRGSHAPQWLEALGLGRPPETTVKAGLSYTTRWYRVPQNRCVERAGDWVTIGMATQFPNRPLSGAISRVEGDQMLVTVIVTGNQPPPEDEADFLRFAQRIPDPVFYDIVKDAEPISPLHKFRGGINRRRHYEQMKGWPQGLVVLGDAACTLNPVYGQGMTVAALSARLLGECMTEARGRGAPLATQDFQKRLARVQLIPWLMATAEDALWEAGPKATALQRFNYGLQQQLVSGLLSTVEGSLRFIHVLHMLSSPLTLAQPSTLFHAARGLRKQRASAAAPPVSGPVAG
jgi:2-polyprenyl-6-methoxyphenol hydroxylase-like FAD-dependent oxidoreductase